MSISLPNLSPTLHMCLSIGEKKKSTEWTRPGVTKWLNLGDFEPPGELGRSQASTAEHSKSKARAEDAGSKSCKHTAQML